MVQKGGRCTWRGRACRRPPGSPPDKLFAASAPLSTCPVLQQTSAQSRARTAADDRGSDTGIPTWVQDSRLNAASADEACEAEPGKSIVTPDIMARRAGIDSVLVSRGTCACARNCQSKKSVRTLDILYTKHFFRVDKRCVTTRSPIACPQLHRMSCVCVAQTLIKYPSHPWGCPCVRAAPQPRRLARSVLTTCTRRASARSSPSVG